MVGTRRPALSVAPAGQSVAGLPGHAAPGRPVGDFHAARWSRAVAGREPTHRDQLRAPAPARAAMVPAVLRRVELGRAGLVDQRGVVGLPDVRTARGRHLPDRPCDKGANPDGAGADLLAAAARRLRLTDRTRRAAGYLSVLLIVAIVGVLYLFAGHPVPGMVDSGGLVDVLFVPLVATLAVGAGTLPWLLSTGLLGFGGRISFCLYMVHELVHTAWHWVAAQFELTLAGYVGKLVVIGLFAIAVGAAALLFYLVEEPARGGVRRW